MKLSSLKHIFQTRHIAEANADEMWQACLSTSAGLILSSFNFFIVAVIFLVISGYHHAHTLFSSSVVIALIIVSLSRYLHGAFQPLINQQHWRNWLIGYSLSTLAAGALWGASFAFVLHNEGINEHAILMAALTVGLANDAIFHLKSFLRLAQLQISLLILPAIFVPILSAEAFVISITLLASAYYIVLLSRVKKLSQLYWNEVEQSRISSKQTLELLKARVQTQSAIIKQANFLSNLCIELKTPLNRIIGIVSALQNTTLDKSQSQYIEKLLKSSHQLETFVTDANLCSKLETGDIETNLETTDIRQFLFDSVDTHYPSAFKKKIGLHIRFQPQLPQQILIDKYLTQLLITQLIDNAIKFTNQGYVLVNAEYLLTANNQRVLSIAIKDCGIGIRDEHLNEIFQPFSNARKETAQKFESTGMGLTNCSAICQRLNGSIVVDSVLEQGSTFTVNLPIDQRHNFENEQDNNLTTDTEMQGLLILLIDDCSISQWIIAEQLHQLGHHCHILPYPEQLAELLESKPCVTPDLILVESSSSQSLQNLIVNALSEISDIPILLLLKQPESRLVDADLSSVSDFHISYPCINKELNDAISRTLSNPKTKQIEPKSATQPLSQPTTLDIRPHSSEFENANILLLEEKLEDQELIGMMLKQLGCKVDLVEDGQTALNYLQQQRYDLIILDPNICFQDNCPTGIEIRRLEQEYNRPNTPIIAVTDDFFQSQREPLDYSDEVVDSPIQLSKLKTLLEKYQHLQ